MLRESQRTRRGTVSVALGGVKTGTRSVIYKCNKYPERFFREAPPPKTVLTSNELPYIMGVEGVIMPKIYEYNPDTDTVRERERTKMKEKNRKVTSFLLHLFGMHLFIKTKKLDLDIFNSI